MKKKNLFIFITGVLVFSFFLLKTNCYASLKCPKCPNNLTFHDGKNLCCEDILCKKPEIPVSPTYEYCSENQFCDEGKGCKDKEPSKEICGEQDYPNNNCCVDNSEDKFCHNNLEPDLQGVFCKCITPEEKCTKDGKIWSKEDGCKDDWFKIEEGENCPEGWKKVERGDPDNEWNPTPSEYYCEYDGESGKNIPAIKPTLCDSDTGIQTAIGCIPTEPGAFVTKFITWAIGIAGGVAFLLMLFSAFGILTSAGDPEKLKASQERLTSAIIGLLFIIFSVFLLRIIGTPIMELGS